MNKKDYTVLQLDAIKELANIGGGNAATSISQMIDKPVYMTVPTIDIQNYEKVYENNLPEDAIVNAVIMRMLGDGEGTFLYTITEYVSRELIEMMVPNGSEVSQDLAYSALTELVNIIVSSYLNSISKMININLISSVPVLTTDMFGALLSSTYIETEQYDENIMIIKNEFLYQGKTLDSSLFFVPRPGVLSSLFDKLGV